MFPPVNEGEDSLLDRMEHIEEEEEEEEEDVEEHSMDQDNLFPVAYFRPDDDVSETINSKEEYNTILNSSKVYQWAPTISPEVSETASYNSQEYHMSGLSNDEPHSSGLGDSFSEEDSLHSSVVTTSYKRGSFSDPRRRSSSRMSVSSSYSSYDGSEHSNPVPTRRATLTVPESKEETNQLARGSILNRQVYRRTQSVSLKSISAGSVFSEDDETSSNASSGIRSIKRRFSRKPYRSTSHTTPGRNFKNGSVVFDSVDTAMCTWGQRCNSERENMAAAAAVVAAGTSGGNNKIFSVNEPVLVFLNILNRTNSVDHKDSFTVTPVNKYGYPPGEGKHAEHYQGPYVYVLATVRKVHFDEDAPYYTVERADTGTEQRADTVWMEQFKLPESLEFALRAALTTSRSVTVEDHATNEYTGFEWISAVLSWPVHFSKVTFIPWYKRNRSILKAHVAHMLYGDSPYACRMRVTGINLLVLCSLVYIFLEIIALAFFPASADNALAVVGAFVWSVLAMELLIEWTIRPADFLDLIASDKAYAPSTTRFINAYHLFFEVISLALFVPNFICLHKGNCGARVPFSGLDSSLSAVLGPTKWDSVLGRLFIGFRTLRIFGLVRHWKKMWINNTFRDVRLQRGIFHNFFLVKDNSVPINITRSFFPKKRKSKFEVDHQTEYDTVEPSLQSNNEEDQRFRKAATIGTALMVVNSHRSLFILYIIVTVMPIISCINGINSISEEFVDLLQANNVMALENSDADCDFFEATLISWLAAAAVVLSTSDTNDAYVLWAQVLPKRCEFQRDDGVITYCSKEVATVLEPCNVWATAPLNTEDATPLYFADQLDIRVGAITEYRKFTTNTWFDVSEDNVSTEMTNFTFSVKVLINQNETVSYANMSSFLLLSSILLICLTGLTVLRGDAGRLVLHPLQRMLKIVVRYAQNPLSSTAARKTKHRRRRNNNVDGDGSESDADKDGDTEQLGNYETEQLINAISKIADLLRKCWGVAGAGIISSNLARTQDGKTVVFNPTVPGKRVYALFGFVAINGFSDQLRALDRDVMILINDVAKVVHDEVFRWALGDSGQCNKNLGAAFLMVFRIGDFTEVHEKKARATDVVFSGSKEKSSVKRKKSPRGGRVINHGKSRQERGRGRICNSSRHINGRVDPYDDTLQLASLPGIQAFSDRALLGMLKSFAGTHRDRNLQNWKKDFRLGAGVGAFTVNIIVGMDAGWAVEGAVGSEYKIDATYLSPHVNMASRMMSAAKQYGVTILLSQAVEELLSPPARAKLRHLDTVYVKGSSVAQRIFTYDARHKGVDFFLFERSAERSDLDAEAYNPCIWELDEDLRAMRQHVTEDFESKFKEGIKEYLHGDWKDAIVSLQEADDIMIRTVLEEGYIDYNPDEIDERIFDAKNRSEDIVRIRNDLGDGTCKVLIAYMERRDGISPSDWMGVRPLTSK